MGRVVKNARVNTQRYQTSVPRVDRPSNAADDSLYAQPTAEQEELVELPSPAPPPVDLDAIARQARDLIDSAEAHAKALVNDAFQRATALLADAQQRGDALVVAVQ